MITDRHRLIHAKCIDADDIWLIWRAFARLLLCLQGGGRHEGEVKERSSHSQGEGKCRILRVGEEAAPAGGHHKSAGQSIHHKTDHQLSQDETGLPGWWVPTFLLIILFEMLLLLIFNVYKSVKFNIAKCFIFSPISNHCCWKYIFFCLKCSFAVFSAPKIPRCFFSQC